MNRRRGRRRAAGAPDQRANVAPSVHQSGGVLNHRKTKGGLSSSGYDSDSGSDGGVPISKTINHGSEAGTKAVGNGAGQTTNADFQGKKGESGRPRPTPLDLNKSTAPTKNQPGATSSTMAPITAFKVPEKRQLNVGMENTSVDIMDLVNKTYPPKDMVHNTVGDNRGYSSDLPDATGALPSHLASSVERARKAVQNEETTNANAASRMASMYPQFTVNTVLGDNTGLRDMLARPLQNKYRTMHMSTQPVQSVCKPVNQCDGNKTPVPGPHQSAGNNGYGPFAPPSDHHPGMINSGHQNMRQHSYAQITSNQMSRQHVGGSNQNMSPQAMAPNSNNQIAGSNPATQLVLATASDNGGSGMPLAVFSPPTLVMKSMRSAMLNTLVGGGMPKENRLLSPAFFPFVENATVRPRMPQYGVLLMKNISFNITRAEVLALFGRNLNLLRDLEEPVHIIMCKVTSKTHDVFVEFEDYEGAVEAQRKLTDMQSRPRVARLGDRVVESEVSSQAALMSALFPFARGLKWKGNDPVMSDHNPRYPFENFNGYVSREEMTMIVKHVEVPQRSPFSHGCPERPFESMISTLKKFPWHTTGYITIKQRHMIFEACRKMIDHLRHVLVSKSSRIIGVERLTPQLMRRFITACMLCPGFTVVQKDDIASLVGLSEHEILQFNMPRAASSWAHLYALGPKPNIAHDVLEYYIAVIREQTCRGVQSLPLQLKSSLAQLAVTTDDYFGYF